MKRTKKIFALCIVPFLALFFVSTAWSEKVVTSLNKNTITRLFDHVVVMGSDLEENLNKPIPLMRLYASKEGKMQPISFQIDEIVENGDWVLPNKSPYLSEKQADKSILIKDDPPEVMDENDELAFMITDIGDQADPAAWPSGWIYADEITLTDPLTNEQGWVYLLSFTSPPERSPVDYVEYRLPENKRDRIYSENFTLGFSHEVPITQDYASFNDDDNIYDRLKIRIFYRFFYIIKFDRNENDMDSLVWQYKDGPVRAVRMVRSSIRLVRNLQSPKVSSETLYYKNAVLMPMRIKGSLPSGIVNEAYFDSGSDFRDRYGWKVRLNTDERWLSVDGKMDELEKTVNTDGARWFILKGPGRAMILFLHFIEDRGLEKKFHYLDDDVNEHPPEFHPGQVPYIGFHIFGMEKINRDISFHVICFYLNKEYTEEELIRAMNIFDNPIQTSVQGFTNSNQEVSLSRQF